MRQTRKPTGNPGWPFMLLTGPEKTGKTYELARATASPLVGHAFWIGCGEPDPDEYAPIGDWEFVPHNGTHRDMLAALREASAEPRKDGLPTLLSVDSIGRWWDLLSDMAQEAANRRQAAKAQRLNHPVPVDDAVIGTDLWNEAKDRWGDILDVLRAHDGPVIVTARLENIAVVDDQGNPTRDRLWKVKAEKGLPSAVNTIVQVTELGKAYLTGTKSLRQRPDTLKELAYWKPVKDPAKPGRPCPIEKVWEALGMSEAQAVTYRPASASASRRAEAHVVQARGPLLEEIRIAARDAGVSLDMVAAAWAEDHGGQNIGEATDLGGLELLRDDLLMRRVQADRDEYDAQHQAAEEPKGDDNG